MINYEEEITVIKMNTFKNLKKALRLIKFIHSYALFLALGGITILSIVDYFVIKIPNNSTSIDILIGLLFYGFFTTCIPKKSYPDVDCPTHPDSYFSASSMGNTKISHIYNIYEEGAVNFEQ
jgi:hypothetical protein